MHPLLYKTQFRVCPKCKTMLMATSRALIKIRVRLSIRSSSFNSNNSNSLLTLFLTWLTIRVLEEIWSGVHKPKTMGKWINYWKQVQDCLRKINLKFWIRAVRAVKTEVIIEAIKGLIHSLHQRDTELKVNVDWIFTQYW